MSDIILILWLAGAVITIIFSWCDEPGAAQHVAGVIFALLWPFWAAVLLICMAIDLALWRRASMARRVR